MRAAVVLSLLLAASVHGAWVISQPYTDYPLLEMDFAATGMSAADPPLPVGGISTSRMGIYNFGEVPCGLFENCTDASIARGLTEASAALEEGLYAQILHDQECILLRWNTSRTETAPTYLVFRMEASRYTRQTRIGMQFNFYNDQPGSVSFRISSTNTSTFNMNTLRQSAVPYTSGGAADANPSWVTFPYYTSALGIPAGTEEQAYFFLELRCDGCISELSDAVSLCNIVARGTNTTSFDYVAEEIPSTVCAQLEYTYSTWTDETTEYWIAKTGILLHVPTTNITIISIKNGPKTDKDRDTTVVCFKTYGLPWFAVANSLVDSDPVAYDFVVYHAYREGSPNIFEYIGITPAATAGVIIGVIFLTAFIVAGVIYLRERKAKMPRGPEVVPMENL